MGSQIDISDYVAACRLASRRSRIVYLAIATFSALVLSGISPPDSRQQQFQLAEDVLHWHDDLVSGKQPAFTGNATNRAKSKADFDSAKRFYDKHKNLLKDRSKAEQVLVPLIAEGITNRQVVKLPILGISLDLLDSRNLSILSGIVFSILLLVFRFSLYREQENLEISFAAAREQSALSQCYDLLQMNQVLFIPKSNWRQSRKVTPASKKIAKSRLSQGLTRAWDYLQKAWNYLPRAWNYLPLSVFWAPVLLHPGLAYHTYETLREVDPGSSDEMWTNLGNFSLLVAIALLTRSCFKMSARMDKHWKEQRDLIDNAEAITEESVSGRWRYEAQDSQGCYRGVADFSTDDSGHLKIEGTRTWHKTTSGEIVEEHLKWHSEQVLINHGKIMFDFHVDEPGKKPRRIWCVLEETQDGLKGEHTHLSGEQLGEVHFFREGQVPQNPTPSA